MAMRRFRVAEDSMRPTLSPGEEIVATDSRPSQIGDLVVFPHPERDDFWMVKRRVTPPEHLPDDLVWVLSDNPEVTRADSRTLGPLRSESVLPVVTTLDTVTFDEACALLSSEDPAFESVVSTIGVPEFWRRPTGFATLVLFILEQQVSLESGQAVYRRLLEAAGAMTPEAVLNLGESGIAATGVTRQKTGYLLGLAAAVVDGLDLDALADQPPVTTRETLLSLKGVGPWTADVYLLSALGHPDSFPVGDRALQVGAGEVLGMQAPPTPDELELLSQPWRPVRAAAARLIWHSYLTARGRVEPVTPGSNL